MSYVFLDATIGSEPSNRLIIELFEKEAPQACLFFKALVNHPQGYKRSHFHRVIEDFMIQGGDVDLEALAPSIDDFPKTLENESFPVDKAGLVGLAMTNVAENNPQFFVTLAPAEHLLGKHSIFGRVVKGMEMVEKISRVEVDDEDKPVAENEVVIVGCGELQRRKSPARDRSASPSSKRPHETNGRSRERSVSPRRDSERRKPNSQSPERRRSEHKRRRSEQDDGPDGDNRHRHHHHHRHDDRQAPREERDRTMDNVPTGPRGYRPPPRQAQQQYRPNDNYGRLGYVDEDDDYRDDEERLQEAERSRDAERGPREPEVRYKGRGAMKYRERH
jgi:peptidyl-prolyl isomerase G (cyclophilin G)